MKQAARPWISIDAGRKRRNRENRIAAEIYTFPLSLMFDAILIDERFFSTDFLRTNAK
jgi:hypothetical protein